MKVTVKQLKEMLEKYSDDMTVVTPCLYTEGFKNVSEPAKRLIKKKDDKYYPLYKTQSELGEEEVLVLW